MADTALDAGLIFPPEPNYCVETIEPGDALLVWPGARLPGIEPRQAVALAAPATFGGGTMCVRVEYLSGHRIGGTDYIALTHVDVVTPSRTDRQPPNPATHAKGGQRASAPDA